MSNLIKSGKVVDLGIPVNVGVTYAFNSTKNSIVEKSATLPQKAINRVAIDPAIPLLGVLSG